MSVAGRGKRCWRLLCCVLLVFPVLRTQAARRVVSLNLCTDQMLVLLAPEKIAGPRYSADRMAQVDR